MVNMQLSYSVTHLSRGLNDHPKITKTKQQQLDMLVQCVSFDLPGFRFSSGYSKTKPGESKGTHCIWIRFEAVRILLQES